MSVLQIISQAAETQNLAIFGHCDVAPGDGLDDARALVLLGPAEPGFWAHVTKTPEFLDGAPDPLDRWSARVIGAIAAGVGGRAIMPFGGPPWYPFIQWARRSGRAWPSPVTLLVHDHAGLMVSYRGAIALRETLDKEPEAAPPCQTCAGQPCRSACPVNALSAEGYDIAACHAYLDTEAGQDCMTRGCAARRACPVSQRYGRQETQSAWHMRIFHR